MKWWVLLSLTSFMPHWSFVCLHLGTKTKHNENVETVSYFLPDAQNILDWIMFVESGRVSGLLWTENSLLSLDNLLTEVAKAPSNCWAKQQATSCTQHLTDAGDVFIILAGEIKIVLTDLDESYSGTENGWAAKDSSSVLRVLVLTGERGRSTLILLAELVNSGQAGQLQWWPGEGRRVDSSDRRPMIGIACCDLIQV